MVEIKSPKGLSILLSVITLLFIIGLIVMVFALMSGGLQEATASVTTGSIANESLYFTNGSGTATSVANHDDISLSNVNLQNCSSTFTYVYQEDPDLASSNTSQIWIYVSYLKPDTANASTYWHVRYNYDSAELTRNISFDQDAELLSCWNSNDSYVNIRFFESSRGINLSCSNETGWVDMYSINNSAPSYNTNDCVNPNLTYDGNYSTGARFSLNDTDGIDGGCYQIYNSPPQYLFYEESIYWATNPTICSTIPSNQYTVSGGYIIANDNASNLNENVSASFDYRYTGLSQAGEVVNATSSSIGSVTDWFPIIIVITAMVVLILLTVLIIKAIRSSGLITSA